MMKDLAMFLQTHCIIKDHIPSPGSLFSGNWRRIALNFQKELSPEIKYKSNSGAMIGRRVTGYNDEVPGQVFMNATAPQTTITNNHISFLSQGLLFSGNRRIFLNSQRDSFSNIKHRLKPGSIIGRKVTGYINEV